MKTLILVTTILASTLSFAAPTKTQINEKALQVLIANSSQMSIMNSDLLWAHGNVSQLLAESFATGESTHNQVTNTCSWDKNDELFNCELVILNADNGDGGDESSTSIKYQLNKGDDGLPGAPESLAVFVSRAG